MRISAYLMRLLLAFALGVQLTGCEKVSHTKSYGQFTVTETYSWDRISGTRSNQSAELCVRGRSQCWNADSFELSYVKDTPNDVVAVIERPVEGLRQRLVRFYRLASADRLSCWNCPYDLELALSDGYPIIWAQDARYLLVGHGSKSRPAAASLVLLSFNDVGYEMTELGDWPKPIPKSSFRSDSGAVAWLSCAPHCDLNWYDIEKGVFRQTRTSCPDNYFTYEWVGSDPEPRLHWGAVWPHQICRNSMGEPAYPYQVKPGCELESDLGRLECQPPKPIEVDYDGRPIRNE